MQLSRRRFAEPGISALNCATSPTHLPSNGKSTEKIGFGLLRREVLGTAHVIARCITASINHLIWSALPAIRGAHLVVTA